MKKIIATILALAGCLSLFGCKAGEQATAPTAPTQALIQPTTAPTQAATEPTQPTAEAPTEGPHQHSFGDWVLQAASSCIAEGREERRCQCGFFETRAVAKKAHKLNGNVCKTCRRVEFDENAALVELGVISDSVYGSGNKANYVWDIRVWNGKVYRAAGDYDKNTGSTPILSYDIEKRLWDTSFRANDEAIHGFEVINGTLCAAGIDARESWEFGNYYILDENGKWQQVRNLPNGVHNFDMIECDGRIFAGLGTETVGNTVAVSEDGGKTFTFVPLYKDGQPYDLSAFQYSRTYEFVQLNGTVYALVRFQTKTGYARWAVFGYADGKMHYLAEGTKLIDGSAYNRKYFGGEVEFNGICYIASRGLYTITDFSDPTSWKTISMPNSGKVSDVILRDGAMYVLTSRQDSQTKLYHTVIYKSTTGEAGSFVEVAAYDYSSFPLSFDYDGSHFYIGTGLNELDSSKVGMVLRVKPQ